MSEGTRGSDDLGGSGVAALRMRHVPRVASYSPGCIIQQRPHQAAVRHLSPNWWECLAGTSIFGRFTLHLNEPWEQVYLDLRERL